MTFSQSDVPFLTDRDETIDDAINRHALNVLLLANSQLIDEIFPLMDDPGDADPAGLDGALLDVEHLDDQGDYGRTTFRSTLREQPLGITRLTGRK